MTTTTTASEVGGDGGGNGSNTWNKVSIIHQQPLPAHSHKQEQLVNICKLISQFELKEVGCVWLIELHTNWSISFSVKLIILFRLFY